MPAKSKKSKAPPADDFDDIIAEHLRATVTTSSRSSTSISTSTPIPPSKMIVPEDVMIDCCVDGDLAQLPRWAKLGVRVHSAWPLIVAAWQGKLTMVVCLVRELGADPNGAENEGGRTPVFMAAWQGHEAVLRCLANELGADVAKASHVGCTPQNGAAQKGNEAIVACLVKELGADVNLAAQDGGTPLMVAADMRYSHIINILLKHGVDPLAKHGATSRKHSKPLPGRPHASKPRRTAPTPAAQARGARPARSASRRSIVASIVSMRTARRTRRSARWLPRRGGPPRRKELRVFELRAVGAMSEITTLS
jgi:hypothetical protein